MTVISIYNELLKLTSEELNELILQLENYYNITSTLVDTNIDQNNNEESKGEEKETKIVDIEIYLDSILPDKKISVLKVVKNLLNLGLKETKEIIDNLPYKLKKTNSKDEADEYKKQLEEAGAIVSFK